MALGIDGLERSVGRPDDLLVWPDWVLAAAYRGSAHPAATTSEPIAAGANCQRYAYAVLGLFDRIVPPHRSSDLWADPALPHVTRKDAAALDLALFNAAADPWGAHVAVVLDRGLLHLSAEVGEPAIWQWDEFGRRERYAHVVGIVRVPTSAGHQR